MKQSKKKFNLLLSFGLCFIVLIFSFTLSTFAKYIGTITTSDSETGVAKPILEVQATDNTNKVSPINSIEKTFNVVNYNSDNEASEIALKYTIQFVFQGINNIPVTVSLVDLDNNNQTIALDSNNTTVNSILMPANTSTTHHYKVVITWVSGQDSEIYQNLIDTLTIQANVVQKEMI